MGNACRRLRVPAGRRPPQAPRTPSSRREGRPELRRLGLSLTAMLALCLSGCPSDTVMCEGDDQCQGGQVCNLTTRACEAPAVDAGPDAAASDAAKPDAAMAPDVAMVPDAARPPCPRAMRSVNLIAGSGSLAWFTLVWPAPQVIEMFQATYAYDDTSLAAKVATEAAHPLYARKVNGKALWDNLGQKRWVSALLAGQANAHEAFPNAAGNSITIPNGVGGPVQVFAAAAALQQPLKAPVPVLGLKSNGSSYPYRAVPGGPPLVSAATLGEMIDLLSNAAGMGPPLPPAPTQAQIMEWAGAASVDDGVARLAERLIVTANALKLGLVAQVILPVFQDDPHGAFADMARVTRIADGTARVLQAFLDELATADEPTCPGRTLADNVLVTVSGDTPKNSFVRAGWPDSAPGGANWIYVMSGGFMRPGWFGQVMPTSRTNFDPATGNTMTTTTAVSTSAALAAVLYAVSRGQESAVSTYSNEEYRGLIGPTMDAAR